MAIIDITEVQQTGVHPAVIKTPDDIATSLEEYKRFQSQNISWEHFFGIGQDSNGGYHIILSEDKYDISFCALLNMSGWDGEEIYPGNIVSLVGTSRGLSDKPDNVGGGWWPGFVEASNTVPGPVLDQIPELVPENEPEPVLDQMPGPMTDYPQTPAVREQDSYPQISQVNTQESVDNKETSTTSTPTGYTPLEQSATRALLVLISQTGVRVPIIDKEAVVGRHSSCDYIVKGTNVSRRHAVVTRRDGVSFIRDLGSNNGTWINGIRINADTPLQAGDVVKLADQVLKVETI